MIYTVLSLSLCSRLLYVSSFTLRISGHQPRPHVPLENNLKNKPVPIVVASSRSKETKFVEAFFCLPTDIYFIKNCRHSSLLTSKPSHNTNTDCVTENDCYYVVLRSTAFTLKYHQHLHRYGPLEEIRRLCHEVLDH